LPSTRFLHSLSVPILCLSPRDLTIIITMTQSRFWEYPELTCLYKLPAHATFTSYPNRKFALKGIRSCSPWWQSLNGTWDFRLEDTPSNAFELLPISEKLHWGTITVPGNWAMSGFADKPHYTNVQMPFFHPPPLCRKTILPVCIVD
jgi:beta-galactosidase